MGQKANPTSLQLGTKKYWKTSFAEKKLRDTGNFTQLLEIEILEFIERFVNENGFCLKDYKLQYGEKNLKVYLSIFSTNHLFNKKGSTRDTGQQQGEGSLVLLKHQDTGVIINIKSDKISGGQLHKTLLQLLVKSLSKRLGGEKTEIFIEYVNSGLNIGNREKAAVKKSFLSLRRFKKQFFFIESFNAAFLLTKDQNAASILLKILVYYFKITKQTRPLTKFFKKALTLLVDSPGNSLKGLKLKIVGRLTKTGRARSFTILVGDVPCHSTNQPVNYTFSYNQNQSGSYGVKLWVVNK